jgi:hypothetical protein
MKFRSLVVGLLLATSVAPGSSATTRVGNDKGGSLGEYLLRFTKIRESGERVIIDGNCFSACTLVTIIPKERICVTQRAALGFHAGWVSDLSSIHPRSAAGLMITVVSALASSF